MEKKKYEDTDEKCNWKFLREKIISFINFIYFLYFSTGFIITLLEFEPSKNASFIQSLVDTIKFAIDIIFWLPFKLASIFCNI
ncbi:hypothetical protein [Thermosipho sp. (in: thermotogales)]|jgi:hypothetical protein|uniref:hypothetical protein n=1 Tax=Thermosipho sp. (in: thermotogales) TaxID=1968895 RepID=UPI00257F8D57|nr:hypothetical protein [Thermosipho sp. (in: thermotogales)]MBZ4649197.1 hypothetical protein [Thermosipho sp. (in: thermotogales)]